MNEPGYSISYQIACSERWQISLRIRTRWSEFSLTTWRRLGSFVSKECPAKTLISPARKRRLIWVFAWRTCSFEGNVVSRLKQTLRKHAYSNIQKILTPKTENFQIKNSDIFHISAQNIDYGYSLEPPQRGGSNEYPQSIYLSRNKKNNVYPCKPQFYYIKVGFEGVKII